MDFLEKQSKSQLKNMEAVYKDARNKLYKILDEQNKSIPTEEINEKRNATLSSITMCSNAIELIGEYINYRDQSVNLTSEKPIKSFKATCGKSVRKSAEEYINKTKDSLFTTIENRIDDNKNQLEVHPDYAKYSDNFEDFEQEVTSGSFKTENIDDSEPEGWDNDLELRKGKIMKDDLELQKNGKMPDDIADFATKFSELRFGTSFQEQENDPRYRTFEQDRKEDHNEYWTIRRFRMKKEQLNSLGIEDADRTINGLLIPVHFDLEDQPKSDQDKVNYYTNMEVRQGLLQGGEVADLTYLKAFQRKVLEVLRLELKPEQLNYEFIIKNPGLFARINMYGKLYDGYKQIKNFETKFPKSNAFIQKYMLEEKKDKPLIGQLIDSKFEEVHHYYEAAMTILRNHGFHCSNFPFEYYKEVDAEDQENINMEELNTLTQKRKDLEASLQSRTEMTRKMTAAYEAQRDEYFARNHITDPTQEQIEAYKTYNMRKSISDNRKYASLIADIQRNYPDLAGEKMSSLILKAQLMPYQNVNGDPVTEEDEKIYNENIRILTKFIEGETIEGAPEEDKTADDVMALKGMEYYREMAGLPEITVDDVAKYTIDPVERFKFVRKLEGKILCFSSYAGDDEATPLSKKWSPYKPDANGNVKLSIRGVSWEKLNDKIDIYMKLSEMINLENKMDGYNFEAEKLYKEVDPQDVGAINTSHKEIRDRLIEKITEYDKKYHAQQ